MKDYIQYIYIYIHINSTVKVKDLLFSEYHVLHLVYQHVSKGKIKYNLLEGMA